MLTSILVVLVAGILLGLWFKAAALLAASAVLFVGILVWNALGLPSHMTIGKSLILMFCLACGYLVGLALSLHRNRNEE